MSAAGERIQLRTYVAQHFEKRLAGLSPNCRARYGSQLRRHIVPALGRMPLDRIDAAAVQSLLADLLKKKLSPSSAVSIGRLLLRVLSIAEMQGRSVCRIDGRRLVWPRSQTVTAEPRAFSEEEIRKILAAATDWPRMLYALMAWSGLRIGEALGLAWEHLELDRALLHVRQQASRGKLRTLKSRTSSADLPVANELQAILAAFWRSQGCPGTGLLFGGAAGLPRRAEGIATRHLTPLLKKLGIPHAGPHAFRHGFCKRCWAAGLPADVIRRLMRHSNLQMTLRYSHTGADELRAGIERLSQHFSAQS